MNVRPICAIVIGAVVLVAVRAWAVDQTVPGAGNARAIELANKCDTANYNNKFRNPVFSLLTAERLTVMYAQGGLEAVAAEIQKLRSLGFI